MSESLRSHYEASTGGAPRALRNGIAACRAMGQVTGGSGEHGGEYLIHRYSVSAAGRGSLTLAVLEVGNSNSLGPLGVPLATHPRTPCEGRSHDEPSLQHK